MWWGVKGDEEDVYFFFLRFSIYLFILLFIFGCIGS